MTEQEFIKNIKKVNRSRTHKIMNSVGVEEFIQHYVKIDRNTPTSIVRQIVKLTNQYLANNLSQGIEIKLPQQMGALELRCNDSYVKFENGKLKTNRMIDWNKTLQLWFNDTEARINKQLVRLENKKIFSVFYNRYKAKYNNKVFYEFIPNRTLKQAIKNNINNGIVTDSFHL